MPWSQTTVEPLPKDDIPQDYELKGTIICRFYGARLQRSRYLKVSASLTNRNITYYRCQSQAR